MYKVMAVKKSDVKATLQDFGAYSIQAIKDMNKRFGVTFYERKTYHLAALKPDGYESIDTYVQGTLGPDFECLAIFRFQLKEGLSAAKALRRLFSDDHTFPRVIDCAMATNLARWYALLKCIGDTQFDDCFGSEDKPGTLGRFIISRIDALDNTLRDLTEYEELGIEKGDFYDWDNYSIVYFEGVPEYKTDFH